jgi:hypothetical protein
MEPTEQQVIPSAQRLAVLTELISSTNAFASPTAILYQNNVALSARTVPADLTVATYVGYANVVAPAWETPYIDTDGSALVFSTNQTIVCTSNATPNTIYGWALLKSDLSKLWAAGAFSTPIGIANPGDAVTFLPALRYSGN